MADSKFKNVSDLRDVLLVTDDKPKTPAQQVMLATQNNFPCDSCSKEFPKLNARAVHMKKSHNIDTIKYTPGPVNRNPWIYCKQCPTKKKTEKEIEIHVTMMHKHVKRSLSEMKKGQIQRVESTKLSPPQKKTKGKLMNPQTTTKVEHSKSKIDKLVKSNESLNRLLILREEQIQQQANQLSNMKDNLNNAKQVVSDSNVDMLEKDIDAEKNKEYIDVMETKVLKLENKIKELKETHEKRMSNLEKEALEVDKENKEYKDKVMKAETELNNQRRRMQLWEEENSKLAEETKYFKKENEEASKYIREINEINQHSIQVLNNKIATQEQVIFSMNKELEKYTIPRYTPTAKIVTPPVAAGLVQHQVAQEQQVASQEQVTSNQVVPQQVGPQKVTPQQVAPPQVDECVRNIRCEGDCEHVTCQMETGDTEPETEVETEGEELQQGSREPQEQEEGQGHEEGH